MDGNGFFTRSRCLANQNREPHSGVIGSGEGGRAFRNWLDSRRCRGQEVGLDATKVVVCHRVNDAKASGSRIYDVAAFGIPHKRL